MEQRAKNRSETLESRTLEYTAVVNRGRREQARAVRAALHALGARVRRLL